MAVEAYRSDLESWGRYPKARHVARQVDWRTRNLVVPDDSRSVLPYGQGRSYGDTCLNDGGVLLLTNGLDRFISFDAKSGILRCEAGITLADLLQLVVPQGWFLPITPGTKYVSIGGAIASDVHGKNHHGAGTFGRFVKKFELLRSNGVRILCSPEENPDWYRATIGGLGLTGLIVWAEIQLRPISNPLIQMESVRFENLDEFFELSSESDKTFEYTVAWIDCFSRGKSLGRGLFLRGNHLARLDKTPSLYQGRSVTVPFDAPNFLLNEYTARAFNWLFYHRQQRRLVERLTHYEHFFYPLDAVRGWNRLYGRRGFFQYQCVVRCGESSAPVRELINEVARSGRVPFLAVLKVFGEISSPGMLSFPKPGVTLALDFANQGEATLRMFERLDAIVLEHSGSVYPAKDVRMSPNNFKSFFPRWLEFAPYVDPKISSNFWRRVTAT